MEKTGNDVTVNLGTDPGSSDILFELELVKGKPNHVLLPLADNIDLDPFDIHIASTNWNNVSLDVYIILLKLNP